MSINSQKPRKMKNKTLAIEAAPEAMPVKPNTAATIAIIRNKNDQRNIGFDLNEINNEK
jgi:hypothetical protein